MAVIRHIPVSGYLSDKYAPSILVWDKLGSSLLLKCNNTSVGGWPYYVKSNDASYTLSIIAINDLILSGEKFLVWTRVNESIDFMVGG